MTSPTSTVVIRAAAIYLPIALSVALAVHRRPDRRRIAGASVALAWNLVTLLLLNAIAQRCGWWIFTTDDASVAGTPADLWIGWALLWGVVPQLVDSAYLLHVGLALFALDLVLMPLAEPVVSLGSMWLVGELLGLITCLAPGLMLGRWTVLGSHVRRRATLQFIAFGGLLFYVLPSLVFTVTGENWALLFERPRWHFVLALVVAAPAGAMAIQAVREFAVVGNGTPVPLDPPRQLVTTGPYAYVANPMQVGATFLLAEWAILIGSLALVAAAAMGAVFAIGLAAWNEEDELSQRFGNGWRRYRDNVGLWLPRWRPYRSAPALVYVGSSCMPCSQVGRFLSDRRPQGLDIRAAEELPEDLTRITYRSDETGSESGLAAVGRSLEHVNLAWAVGSWIVRLPLVRPLLQLIADAVGAGPRRLAPHPSLSTNGPATTGPDTT